MERPDNLQAQNRDEGGDVVLKCSRAGNLSVGVFAGAGHPARYSSARVRREPIRSAGAGAPGTEVGPEKSVVKIGPGNERPVWEIGQGMYDRWRRAEGGDSRRGVLLSPTRPAWSRLTRLTDQPGFDESAAAVRDSLGADADALSVNTAFTQLIKVVRSREDFRRCLELFREDCSTRAEDPDWEYRETVASALIQKCLQEGWPDLGVEVVRQGEALRLMVTQRVLSTLVAACSPSEAGAVWTAAKQVRRGKQLARVAFSVMRCYLDNDRMEAAYAIRKEVQEPGIVVHMSPGVVNTLTKVFERKKEWQRKGKAARLGESKTQGSSCRRE